ncbi:MAG: hypothetical protein KJZ95_03950 [Caldilinea sp.]|nr:hypothetical protein [Caldilinea sp.]
MTPNHFLHRSLSVLLALAMVLTPLAPALHAQDGGNVFLPLIGSGAGSNAVASHDVLFRSDITIQTQTQWARLEALGVTVLERREDGATVLVDYEQLADLARLRFQPTNSVEYGALLSAGAELKPWLARSLQPLSEHAQTARAAIESPLAVLSAEVRTTSAELLSLRAAAQMLTTEQRTALATLPSLDDDGDGLTNTEEGWWCTDAQNPNSNGNSYTDGETARALLNYALPRQQRHAYGPPFRLWPPFVDTIAPGVAPTCLLDADHDSIPDLLELYVIGTSPRDESTDGDKFDDGQEFFGITYCPGAPNSCGYGSYPRTQDFSFITDRLPSWVRPPGDNPFVAAYPVIEFNVDPATIRVVTKEIKTVERTITQGEEISTGYAETKGNSTTVGTVDTNTRSGWQEHSSSVGGIEPALAASGATQNLADSITRYDAFNWVVAPTSQVASDTLITVTLSVSRTVRFIKGVVDVSQEIENALIAAVSIIPEDVTQTDTFAVSALSDFGEWKWVTVFGLTGIGDTNVWNVFDNGAWFSSILLHLEDEGRWEAAVRGTTDFSKMLSLVPDEVLSETAKHDLDPLRPRRITNDFGYNFPWEPGHTMQYGTRKVHDNEVASYPGWKAVDFVSGPGVGTAPNSVRAARGGTIELICGPDAFSQATIKLDNLMYTHLRYNSAIHRTGEPRMTGDYLGSMVTGRISGNCGYSTGQEEPYYHLHLGFPNQSTITFENWSLNTSTHNWTNLYNQAVVVPGQTLRSGGIQGNSCTFIPSNFGQTDNSLGGSNRSTNWLEKIGRTVSSWWGRLTGSSAASIAATSNQVAGRSSSQIDFSSSVSAGACGGSGGQTDGGTLGIGGGGSGTAYNDNGGGNFTALRTWSETTTTGEGWSTSHSDVRMETEYSEITRSTVNTLVSSESWATATTADPTDAARMTFNYTLANTGSDLAVQVTGLRANILIGDLPVITVNLPDRTNIEPSKAKGPFSSDSIPLTLDQLAAIDNGAPIRVVLADYGYNDSLYDTNAWGRSVLFHVDDGIEDGDETFDTYLIVTNLVPGETYQETLERYFPVTVFDGGPNDPRTGTLTSITTPEYDANGEITSWIARPVNDRAWWELALSTGGETPGVKNFKDMPAKARSYVYLRYMVDTDGDGYTDRTERDAGTDRNDPNSHPRPLLVAAKHTKVTGSTATVQLALQNLGDFDASSVEIWAIAPDDSITIDDNLVGGGGRVRAGRRVVLGARIGAPDLTAWATSTAKPAPGGQFDGAAATTFQFRADTAGTVGSSAGLQVSWSSDGATWTPLNVGSGYMAWTPLPLADGLSIAFSPGTITAGETFRFATALPIDTFRYTINRTPHTPPLLVVAYNDAQGNHKFVADVETSQIQEDLTRYYAEMRRGLQLDMRQAAPFQAGANRAWLTLYNPSDRAISGAALAVEIVTPDGALAKEYVLPDQTFQPGPNVVTLDWNTADFSPAFDPAAEYHVLAYAADRQGTIIEHTLRGLDTLAEDALPTAIFDDTTWDFGTVAQGEILERTFALANVGFADLQSRALLPTGLTMTSSTSRRSLPGDIADFTLTLDTRTLPTGAYSGTVTLRTSDPAHPLYTVQVSGVIQAASGDAYARTVTDRPLDVEVWVPGNRTQGQWITFEHPLGPEPQSLHPVKVYSQDGAMLHGVGKYATDFSTGTSSYEMFGEGRDGQLYVSSGETKYTDNVRTPVVGTANSTIVPVESTVGFSVGDEVIILQMQGSSAGVYEFGTVSSIQNSNLVLKQALQNTYLGFSHRLNSCGGVFRGEYFSNASLSGSPTLIRCDPTIWFDWGDWSPGPGLPSDNFSTRWTAQLTFPVNGNYTFRTTTDDGVRVYVDGALIINEWHPSDSNSYSASPWLSSGPHTLVVEHYEGGGRARLFFEMPTNLSFTSAQVIRVPHYGDVNVSSGGRVAANPWNGVTGGVLAFRATGRVVIAGVLDATGFGFRGFEKWPSQAEAGHQGESLNSMVFRSRGSNATGGGGGDGYGDGGAGGSGGSHASGGTVGSPRPGGGPSNGVAANTIVGTEALFPKAFFGGAGGSGGSDDSAGPWTSYPCGMGGKGGNGGGIVFVFGREISVMGSIQANGQRGADGGWLCSGGAGGGGGGAGGAGGSIFVKAGSISSGNNLISAAGGGGGAGVAAAGSGGNGGVGRVRIEYCNTPLAFTTNPPASTHKLDCYIVEQAESASYTTSRLNLPENVTGGKAYRIQFSRRAAFGAAGEAAITLRVPAGIWTAASLDALVSGVGSGDVTFKLDVGADGVWDWEQTRSVTNAATFSSPDLAAAFAPYVNGAGQVDVPVRVYLSKPGQVLLTNMSVTRNRSVELAAALALSGTPTEGAVVPLNATVANSGAADSGPLTVSYYATQHATRSTPQYIGSVFVPNIAPGGSAPAPFNWNTLGFTGSVTVTAVVDPYSRIAESDKANNRAAAVLPILTRPDLAFTAVVLSNAEPMAGESVQIVATLANRGQTAAGSQATALYLNNPDGGGVLLQAQTVGSVGGEANRTVTFTWTPSAPGLHRLFLRSDRDSQVNEFDESNNDRWLDVYVGHASPLAIDSGGAGDTAYNAAQGYGAVDSGETDEFGSCEDQPHQSYRRDPSGRVVYRFDHLLPGHFYHLDLVLYECKQNAGRQQRVHVDGIEIAGPVDLGSGEVQNLSLLLDPALYADRAIEVAVTVDGSGGAMVNQIALVDVDYRYADAGGAKDVRYPTGARAYGWLDGVAQTPWGVLPYRSLRENQSGSEVRYRFDALDPAKNYQVHFSFFLGSGNNRVQQIWVDDIPLSGDFTLVAGQRNDQRVDLPKESYTDGTITVAVRRADGAATGAMINEITLEELTQARAANCQVTATPSWSVAFGNVTVAGQPAPAGTVITAETPRGEVVGCYVVENTGQYGFMSVYGEDASSTPVIPGMRAGEPVVFRVNGVMAVPTPQFTWQDNKTRTSINLAAGVTQSQYALLRPNWNLLSTRMAPPVPLLEIVFRSIAGKYCLVLGPRGIFDCTLPAGFQSLKEIAPGKAYYTRITGGASVNLVVEGVPQAADTPLALERGLNWVGYLPTAKQPVATALQSISSQLLQAADGQGRIYDPALPGFSTLQELLPGQGYLLHLREAATLVYPTTAAASADDALLDAEAIEGTGTIHCANVEPTPRFTALYGKLTVDGADVAVGSQVEVYTPRGEVAGCFLVTTPGQYGFLAVFGADTASDASDALPGFQDGEPIEVRIDGVTVALAEALTWQDDKSTHQLDLEMTRPDQTPLYLPVISR